MKQILAAAIAVAGIVGTPTLAIAQDGWSTMLLPGGVLAARTVLGLRGTPDRVEEFLLADIARAPEIVTFNRYIAHLEQVAAEAEAWPEGLTVPRDNTPRADRDRAKRLLSLLGLTLESGNTVAAGTSTEARERQAWLAAAGVNPRDLVEPLNSGAAVTVTIPQGELPLPLPDFWKTVNARQSPLQTIVASRQSAQFYAGLLSLDPQTLKYLEARPSLSALLRSRHADGFATIARSIQVHGGRVVPAGGEQTAAMWERLAGARLSSPDTFVPALLSADDGRLAYFFDMVATLDPERRAWVLGADGGDAYSIIRRAGPTSDPLTVVRQLDRTHSDARSLLSWIFAREDEAGARFDACRAAQRLAAQGSCVSAPELPTLLEAAIHTPTLLPLFERLAITDATVISETIRAARQFDADGKGDALRPLAQWQLALALIEQVAVRQRFDSARTTSLVQSWARGASAPGSDSHGRAGEWLVDILLPALAANVPLDDLEVYERDVIVAVARRDHEAADPVRIFWEGIDYLVDDTFAATRDVLTIRVSQHSPTLGDVVRLRGLLRKLEAGVKDLTQVAEIAADVTRVAAATAKLRARDGGEAEIAAEFRKVDKTIREITSDRQVGQANAQVPRMREALDALVEGALLPLVYALAVSPAGVAPSTLIDLPHWHRWEKAAWEPARRDVGAFMESVITGSVIGLDVAMADTRLRAAARTSATESATSNGGADDITTLRSLRAHSENLDWVAEAPRILKALSAGDAVITESDTISPEIETRMRAAGIAPDRIAMVRWQRERGVPRDRQAFTRLDAYRLGTHDPLPAGWRDSDPLTEVMLRLLDGTQSWRLPAGVVPALVPLAAHDWLVQSRAVTRNRIEAYMLGLVSARLLMRPVRSQHP